MEAPLAVAETTAEGNELPSIAERARALAAFIARTQGRDG
jgi:hypothetical protein